jgi:hypothetical protein
VPEESWPTCKADGHPNLEKGGVLLGEGRRRSSTDACGPCRRACRAEQSPASPCFGCAP